MDSAMIAAVEKLLGDNSMSDALDCVDDGVIWGARTRESADREQAAYLVVAAVLYGLGWPS